jgi:hypothetical protein
MRIYECRYVRREDPGDLVFGFMWRPAVLVDECQHLGEAFHYQHRELEALMFDKETGKNVGDTRNYCVDPHCCHEDCAPLTLIWEGEGR